jgi:hypothetical protein
VAIAPNNQEKVATAMRQAGAVNAYAVKVSKGVI